MSSRQRFYAEMAVVTVFGLLAGWFASPHGDWPLPKDRPTISDLSRINICTRDKDGQEYCEGPGP